VPTTSTKGTVHAQYQPSAVSCVPVIDVKNDDLALLFPGMTADAHIITAERSNVLRVPLPAIRFNPEGFNRTALLG
jgi:hypothetical protein